MAFSVGGSGNWLFWRNGVSGLVIIIGIFALWTFFLLSWVSILRSLLLWNGKDSNFWIFLLEIEFKHSIYNVKMHKLAVCPSNIEWKNKKLWIQKNSSVLLEYFGWNLNKKSKKSMKNLKNSSKCSIISENGSHLRRFRLKSHKTSKNVKKLSYASKFHNLFVKMQLNTRENEKKPPRMGKGLEKIKMLHHLLLDWPSLSCN